MHEQRKHSPSRDRVMINPQIDKRSGTFGNFDSSDINKYFVSDVIHDINSNIQHTSEASNPIKIKKITIKNNKEINIAELKQINELKWMNNKILADMRSRFCINSCDGCESLLEMLKFTTQALNKLCDQSMITPIISSTEINKIETEFDHYRTNHILQMFNKNLKWYFQKFKKNLSIKLSQIELINVLRSKEQEQYKEQMDKKIQEAKQQAKKSIDLKVQEIKQQMELKNQQARQQIANKKNIQIETMNNKLQQKIAEKQIINSQLLIKLTEKQSNITNLRAKINTQAKKYQQIISDLNIKITNLQTDLILYK